MNPPAISINLLPWIILFAPLGAAGLIALFTLRDQKLSAGLSTGAVILSFIFSIIFVATVGWRPRLLIESSLNWLSIGDLSVSFGLRFDPLSLFMMLLVTGVASAIHIYSWGYMAGDPGFSRFFACLSLFTFSMLGIVLANNFLELFIFWELVGVSSYLLIGFWFERPEAADAGKKAFITNRLGDFGFIVGILLVWSQLGSLHFGELQAKAGEAGQNLGSVAAIAGLLIFCGAMGKSAQFPLHVWLPDAMEGPTPVSALIHAATMVAAGVYMLCRVFFLLNGQALEVIACIGGFTALMAALIAIQQNDIKRILAYSTLSQLGYMIMSVGLGAPAESMFHLTTHAFFKALLFLGAGSVIVALHHEQDIWKMGKLRSKMPVTYWTFLAGTLALAGIWPFSGFFSKDSILAAALAFPNPVLRCLLFGIGLLVAALTAFYMFRLVFVVFGGAAKSDAADHAHETAPVILWPLRFLAVFSVIAGVIGAERIYRIQFTSEVADYAGEHLSFIEQLFLPFAHSPLAAVLGLLAAGAGIAAAWSLYGKTASDPLPDKLGAFGEAMRNRFYFDELYQATVIPIHDSLASIANWFDRMIIDGFCIGLVRYGTDLLGRTTRFVQTGNLQTYALLFALGVALLLYLVLK